MHLRASIILWLLGALSGPRPRPVVLSTYGAHWTFSLLAPVKFRAGSAPVNKHVSIDFALYGILVGTGPLS